MSRINSACMFLKVDETDVPTIVIVITSDKHRNFASVVLGSYCLALFVSVPMPRFGTC